jgi:putative membrane protein insertion efficiency factor
MHDQERKTVKVDFLFLCRANGKYLRKKVFKPYIKMFCLRLIRFYQKYLSKGAGVCRYTPTCSQYTLESINNNGVVLGIILGAWRILRCNPLSKGGYNPAPFPYRKKKWLL